MIRRVRSRWQGAVLVCRKCSKKAGGKPLAKALRKHLGGGKGRKAETGIVEVACLGICPKAGVTVVDASRPGEWLIFDRGTPVEAVAAALSLATDG